jgi:uncharacterized protein YjbJ (UPF0337 family)
MGQRFRPPPGVLSCVLASNTTANLNKEVLMGIGDKAEHKAEEVAGKVKEGLGDATDNRDLEAEGQAEQSKANVKQAGDDVADALREASAAVKGDEKRL